MCGILAEFTFDNHSLTERNQFESLLELSKQRGPDASGYQSESYFQLGFNRLAILDLSEKGNQPMSSPSGRYHMVFNGEIYNFKELSRTHELKDLISTSDTEVVLHLLDKLGVEKTLRSLDGMFGMAIVDSTDEKIFLVRDFAGIKPLFYGHIVKGVVVASQFDQVFKHPWFKDQLKLDQHVVKEYFGFGYMPAPNTIFKGVQQLEPGHYIEIDRLGSLINKSYCEFNFLEETADYAEPTSDYLNMVESNLKTTVASQLVSDVPLASFLSGGIDSPLITTLAKQSAKNIQAFTVAVNDEELDEGKDAENYAKAIDVNYQIHRIHEGDLIKTIEEHFNGMTEPFGDYSSIPTYVITKLARMNNTVMLSGDGGDELYFGYPRMLDVIKKKKWFKIPFGLRKIIIRITNKLRITNTWAPYHYKTIGEWVTEKHTHIFKTELDGMFNGVEFSENIKALYKNTNVNSDVNLLRWLRYNEFYGHLQRILIKVDRMSMANSLDVRVPFLDKDSIQDALSFTPNHYNSSEQLKTVLKKIMRNYYPENLITKKKKGFTVPLDEWLRNELKTEVKSVIFDGEFYGSEYINVEAVRDYVNRFYTSEHESAWGVWHIYAWQKWAMTQGLI